MFERMLDNKNIRVMLNTDYKDIIDQIEYDKLFVTSPIDEFFDYKY
jgi:UDP-galactopyranose mutase